MILRKPILFLDLDGTVRKGFTELGRFVNKPEDVEVFPEVVPLLRLYRKAGFAIVGITNQGGIATGQAKEDDVHDAIMRTQELCHNLFDHIFMCSHFPGVDDYEMSQCLCRKPKIGMVVLAQSEIAERFGCLCPPHLMLFVGDRPEDEQCAANAGIRFMWAQDWRAQSSVTFETNQLPYEREAAFG